jgi:hypothetical protein
MSSKKKRKWSLLLSRFANELNGSAGITGLSGFAMGILSLFARNAIPEVVYMIGIGLSLIILLASLIIAFARAIPPACLDPKDFLGQSLSLDKLSSFDPQPTRIGVIGIDSVGKTTLIDCLRHNVHQPERTQILYATICQFNLQPLNCFALLDGPGQERSDQFEIAAIADVLCVMIDHNSSNSEYIVDFKRLNDHAQFMHDIRRHLARLRPSAKEIDVFLLYNKQDLWNSSNIGDDSRRQLLTFFDKEYQLWREWSLGIKITSMPYSNYNSLNGLPLLLRQLCCRNQSNP